MSSKIIKESIIRRIEPTDVPTEDEVADIPKEIEVADMVEKKEKQVI